MRVSRLAIMLLGTILVSGIACGLDVSGTLGDDALDDGGDAASSSDAPANVDDAAADVIASDGSIDASTVDADASIDAEAGTTCPSSMVKVTTGPGATTPYCIDKLEVTESLYGQFKAANVSVNVLPQPACATKASFRAGSTRGAQRPVSDVDWCDAWAFCKSLEKRLCSLAEWQNACNNGTGTTFTYGNTFNSATCNGGPIGAPVDVGSLAGCHGPIAGLMDMSGNMDEWSAACSGNTGLGDLCKTHGGDWQNDAEGELMCASTQDRTRGLSAVQIGFRCCK